MWPLTVIGYRGFQDRQSRSLQGAYLLVWYIYQSQLLTVTVHAKLTKQTLFIRFVALSCCWDNLGVPIGYPWLGDILSSWRLASLMGKDEMPRFLTPAYCETRAYGTKCFPGRIAFRRAMLQFFPLRSPSVFWKYDAVGENGHSWLGLQIDFSHNFWLPQLHSCYLQHAHMFMGGHMQKPQKQLDIGRTVGQPAILAKVWHSLSGIWCTVLWGGERKYKY